MDRRMTQKPTGQEETSLCISDGEIEITSEAIFALASTARLKILCLLQEREMAVVELTQRIGKYSQSCVSQHLVFLRKAGIVSCRKESTRAIYQINDARMGSVLTMIAGAFCPSASASASAGLPDHHRSALSPAPHAHP